MANIFYGDMTIVYAEGHRYDIGGESVSPYVCAFPNVHIGIEGFEEFVNRESELRAAFVFFPIRADEKKRIRLPVCVRRCDHFGKVEGLNRFDGRLHCKIPDRFAVHDSNFTIFEISFLVPDE